MNPLGWSFGWTLAVSTGVVLAAITIAVVNAVADSPVECPRCGSLVPPDEQADHDEMHAHLDAEYAAAAGKFVSAGEPRTAPALTTLDPSRDICERAFGPDPTPRVAGPTVTHIAAAEGDD